MTFLKELYAIWIGSQVVFGIAVVMIVAGSARILGPRVVGWLRARRRVGKQVPSSDEHLLDVGYVAGVVEVGDR